MDASTVAATLLVAGAGAAALAVAVRSPFHAFCVFIATLPFESALAVHARLTVAPVYLGLLGVLAVALVHPARRTTYGSMTSWLNRYVLVYLAVAVVSLVMTIVAPPPDVGGTSMLLTWRTSGYRSIVQVAFLFFCASAYFATLFFCATPERVRRVTQLFLVVSAVVALYGLFQMVGVWFHVPLVGPAAASLYDTPASLRPNATFQEPMNFGHFLVLGIPVLASLYLHEPNATTTNGRMYRIVAALMLLTMAAALMLTIGRAAWLGGAVAAVVLLAGSDRRVRRRVLPIAAVGLVAAVVLAVFAFGGPHGAWNTIANRFRPGGTNVTNEQRLWYLPLLFHLVKEYPVLGVGYGNYALYQVFAFNLYGIAGAYGLFSEALVDTGVIGLAALVTLVAACAWALLRAIARDPRSQWRPYLVGWLASLAGSFTAYIFFADRLSVAAWVALGLTAATVRVARQTPAVS